MLIPSTRRNICIISSLSPRLGTLLFVPSAPQASDNLSTPAKTYVRWSFAMPAGFPWPQATSWSFTSTPGRRKVYQLNKTTIWRSVNTHGSGRAGLGETRPTLTAGVGWDTSTNWRRLTTLITVDCVNRKADDWLMTRRVTGLQTNEHSIHVLSCITARQRLSVNSSTHQ